MARLFRPKVLRVLLEEEAVEEQMVGNLLAWPPTGFGAHVSRELPAAAKTPATVIHYMTRLPITSERILGEASKTQVIYRSDSVHPRHQANFCVFDPLDFLAEVYAQSSGIRQFLRSQGKSPLSMAIDGSPPGSCRVSSPPGPLPAPGLFVSPRGALSAAVKQVADAWSQCPPLGRGNGPSALSVLQGRCLPARPLGSVERGSDWNTIIAITENQTNLRVCLLGIEAPVAADGNRLDWPWTVTRNTRAEGARVGPGESA